MKFTSILVLLVPTALFYILCAINHDSFDTASFLPDDKQYLFLLVLVDIILILVNMIYDGIKKTIQSVKNLD